MGQFSHGTQIYYSLDNVIIFSPEISMVTSNALGDYTLPSSFCTTGMIWHELNALINQTRWGKTVQPCWRGPDYSRWLKPNPLRSCQTGMVFFLFANVPEIWKYNNDEILVSAEHLRIGPWEPHRSEWPGWRCLTLWLCGLEVLGECDY